MIVDQPARKAADAVDARTPAALAGALFDALNSHEFDRVLPLISDDYVAVDVADARPQRGPGGLRSAIERYTLAFPDLIIEADEVVTCGDDIALLWTARGTHQGPWLNIPATGRQVRVRGMALLRTRDSRITQATWVWDVAGALRDLGLLPRL